MANILTSLLFPLLQNISPILHPNSSLKSVEKGKWVSLGSDPQFSVKSIFSRVLSGWISVRVHITSECMLTPKLYFDFGEGYSEARVIELRQVDEGVYQTDIMLPKIPKNIRFDPIDEEGNFELSLFQIRVHSDILHTLHQFYTVSYHEYKNKSSVWEYIKKSHVRYKKHGFSGMLERLDKDYTKFHPFRRQKTTSAYMSYLNWIKENEKNSKVIFDKNLFQNTPLISVVMPTYNTPIEYLKKAIDSVVGQSYPYWELCIADDASDDNETIYLLEKYMKKHDNIHVYLRKNNGNIALASNSALSMAKGEYVAFLDHDDMLSSNALLEIVKVINEKEEVKFIYSDEDKIDEKGRRFNPHFKSDWNPDMFLSQNYISHLSVVKRSILKQVGNFRAGYEGSQDYDLFLRITDYVKANEIVHIEKILYHWRAFEGSTAFSPESKSYTTKAGLKALTDYFYVKNVTANVQEGMLPNTYKVSYPLVKEPLVSLIIPTRDGYDILSLCIKSILEKTIYKNYEIIIVDNQTRCPKTLAYFEELTKRHTHISVLAYDKEFNYSAINNFAVAHAKGEIIGLINNDVEIISDHWLTEMVEHAVREEIGAVGAKLYYDNNTIQHAGVVLGIGGVAGHSHKYFKKDEHGYFSRLKIIQNYSAVTAACLVVKKSLYEKVNGLNEKNLTVAFNDVDFCIKLKKLGFRNLWTPYVELYHHESVSRGAENNEIKKARFEKEINYMKATWGETLKNDKFYNSNLTDLSEDFSIKKGTISDSR